MGITYRLRDLSLLAVIRDLTIRTEVPHRHITKAKTYNGLRMNKLCTKQITKLRATEHSWNHGRFDQEQAFTSPSSSYQACHGVTVGSLRASMLYLVDVTGITASVSPLDKVKIRLKQKILVCLPHHLYKPFSHDV